VDGSAKFTDAMLEGGVDVYAFRPFRGDSREAFRRTLFAERMRPESSQPRLLNRRAFQAVTIPGADDALGVNFIAEQNFYTYTHTRVAIFADGAAAVVDVRVRTADRVQANLPAIGAMLELIRVTAAATSGGSATGGAFSVGSRALARCTSAFARCSRAIPSALSAAAPRI
jgi:hypothetical protein